jgi:hypothetical protein
MPAELFSTENNWFFVIGRSSFVCVDCKRNIVHLIQEKSGFYEGDAFLGTDKHIYREGAIRICGIST